METQTLYSSFHQNCDNHVFQGIYSSMVGEENGMEFDPTVALKALLAGGVAIFAKVGAMMKAAGGVKVGAATAAVSAAAAAAVSGNQTRKVSAQTQVNLLIEDFTE